MSLHQGRVSWARRGQDRACGGEPQLERSGSKGIIFDPRFGLGPSDAVPARQSRNQLGECS